MAKRLKHIRAGLVNYDYLIAVPAKGDSPRVRAAKRAASSAAQQYMNLKNSWRELELKLAANFGSKDHVVTFTYDDNHLPADKEEAGKEFQKFVRKLRGVRRRRLDDLLYVYVTEGFHSKSAYSFLLEDGHLEDRRLHHHVVLNWTGPGDYDELRSLWHGGGYIRIEPLDVHYYRELAKYMTKEAREFGRPKVGERTWRASRNLKSYEVEYTDIPSDSMTLAPPFGAVDYESFGEANPYGYAMFVGARYLLYKEVDPGLSYTEGRRRPPLSHFQP